MAKTETLTRSEKLLLGEPGGEDTPQLPPTRTFLLTRIDPKTNEVVEVTIEAHLLQFLEDKLCFVRYTQTAEGVQGSYPLIIADTFIDCREIVLPAPSSLLLH